MSLWSQSYNFHLRPGNAGRKAAARRCFLRQHYLGQVQRVFRVPRETLSLAPTATLVGSPNNLKLERFARSVKRANAGKIFAKACEIKTAGKTVHANLTRTNAATR
jgi:hypothetical protein